jgi:hypothetical protein
MFYAILGSSELHPFPAVPRVAAADGGRGAGGLAPLHTQGSGLQGGEGQPHLQVIICLNVFIKFDTRCSGSNA